jgi:hypothetical protein
MLILLGLLAATGAGLLTGRLARGNWPWLAVASVVGTVMCAFGVEALRHPSSCADAFDCAVPGGDTLLGLFGVVVGGALAIVGGVAALTAALRSESAEWLKALGALPLVAFAVVVGPAIARDWAGDVERHHAEAVAQRFFEAVRSGSTDDACKETNGFVRNEGDIHPCPYVVEKIRRVAEEPSPLRVVSASRLDEHTYVVYFHQGTPNVVAYVTDGEVSLADAS